jgi:hypothetical protein
MPETVEPGKEDGTANDRMSTLTGSIYEFSTLLNLKTTDIELTTSEVDDIPIEGGQIEKEKLTLTGSLHGFASLLSLETTDTDLTISGVDDSPSESEKNEDKTVIETEADPSVSLP